jgi:hypothetical protein
MELTHLIKGEGDADAVRAVQQAFARFGRLGEGISPGTTDLQYFGSAHQTGAAIRDQVRLRIAPAS